MKLLRVIGVSALVLSSAASAMAQPTFRAGIKIVPLYVTVTDAERRLVPDLVSDDFAILEDAKPRKVELFQSESLPITVVVMLDTSGSMTLALDEVKAGAEAFLLRLLPTDKGMVGAFNDKIQFTSSEFSNDRDTLAASLKDIDFGYPTRLYDAIDASMEQLKGVEGRKVVLVFTDGEDTASRLGSGAVVDRARTEGVMIYGIGLRTKIPGVPASRPDRVLKKLADETGGGYFELKSNSELSSTFTRVAQELHSQYVLGFSPERLDGKVHKLDVQVKKPGMTARSRKSYVASPEGTTNP
ncbi:MAG: VWA domain-containing protein [Acidobacteriota bacterium]